MSKKAAAGAACQRNGKYHMCVLLAFTLCFVSYGALWLPRFSKGVWHCLEVRTCRLYSMLAVFCVFIHGGHVSIFSAHRGCGQIEGLSNGERSRGWQETQRTHQPANRSRCERTRVALSSVTRNVVDSTKDAAETACQRSGKCM